VMDGVVTVDADVGTVVVEIVAVVRLAVVVSVFVDDVNLGAGGATHTHVKLPANVCSLLQKNSSRVSRVHLLCCAAVAYAGMGLMR
jgi:hypothetical protein